MGSRNDEAHPREPFGGAPTPQPTYAAAAATARGPATDPFQLLPSNPVQPHAPPIALPPPFRDIMGSTCNGTVAIGPNATSSPDKQPFVVPGQKVATRAHFHFKANGTAWVRFDAFGQRPLDLPLRFTRDGMTWTGEYGIAYTVQPSGDRSLTGLAAFFRNDSARLDLTCAQSASDTL